MALTDTTRGGSVAPPDDDAGDVGPDGRAGLVARAWRLPLLAHVAVLAVALGLLLPLARPTVPTPDEGAYGIQAELVAGGQWDYRPPLAELTRTAPGSPSAAPTRTTAAGTRTSTAACPGGDGPAHRVVRPRRGYRALLPGRGGRGRGRGVAPAKELDPRRSHVAFGSPPPARCWSTGSWPVRTPGRPPAREPRRARPCGSVVEDRPQALRGVCARALRRRARALGGGAVRGLPAAGGRAGQWRRSGPGPAISAVAVPGLAS